MILSADLSGMDLIEAVRKAPASEYLLVEPSGQVYGVLATVRPRPRVRGHAESRERARPPPVRR